MRVCKFLVFDQSECMHCVIDFFLSWLSVFLFLSIFFIFIKGGEVIEILLIFTCNNSLMHWEHEFSIIKEYTTIMLCRSIKPDSFSNCSIPLQIQIVA